MSSNSNDRVIRAGNGPLDPMANALRALAMDAVQQAIKQHRRMAVGQHEAVAVGPMRIGGVVPQVSLP